MADNICKLVDEEAVRALLEMKRVTTFFQPVVSILSKCIVGFEAFSRPAGEDCNVDTRMLFHAGLSPDVMLEVDRLCRMNALRQFQSIHAGHKGMLLFLKVNAECLPHIEMDKLILPGQLKEVDMGLESVVLQIPLAVPHVDKALQLFEKLREMGVRLCLDNCSEDAAFSLALNRFKPDFVKVNRTFFGEEERGEHTFETLAGVISRANRVGAQVIGQGVETEEESIRLLSAGIHLQQGYYYSKDAASGGSDAAKAFLEKIVKTNDKFRVVRQQLVRRKKERFAEAFRNVSKVAAKLSNVSEDRFEQACRAIVNGSQDHVSVFVLDREGSQVTDRVYASGTRVSENTAAIMGSQKGADHSAQDYVLYLEMGYLQFVTPPFASLAGGVNACLVSKPFFNTQGVRYTMCLEMAYPG
ncbi:MULTISPECIES: EAL domain-containing protein [unclassified Pseudodesulfovibrio]|uniref:EAL domain-containing protein n=1 Tax=unclassified Pseudodesulfovibrio TaxID=2661612 RepID=UPI000FEBD7B3|nr:MULTISPECIES: EAL domain-containing protein [unclassified Pseudodesulfovibrio]MCJ2166266.1 EAL domain-containing protein [Pseudodesulfovibrio sp. S3-i]RWU02297.1 EAL domain-containing protein [Pseudodesulfovibrio sp. S3]